MAVGARDYIDKLLVEKYAKEQVDNHGDDAFVSKVSANDMLTAMNSSANHYKNMLALNQRLTVVCYGIVAKNAKYKPIDDEAALNR